MRLPLPTGTIERRPRATLLVAGFALTLAVIAITFQTLNGRSGSVWLDASVAQVATFSTVFLGIFFEAAPFLLLGVIVSSALHLYVQPATITRLAPRRAVPAALMGAGMGFIFPVCECGVVPVSRRLASKGAPLPMALTLLLAAPVLNPVVLLSTWVAFGGDWWMVGWRAGLTLVVAVIVGLLIGSHPRPASLLAPGVLTEAATNHHHGLAHSPGERFRDVLWHSGGEFVEMSRYLVAGALLAAAVQTFVPRSSLLTLGDSPVSGILVMIGLATVLSICSTIDAFIALTFAGTFSGGALLAFLVFGPMIDIKAVLLFHSIFQRKTVALIVLLVFQCVFLAALALSYWSPR
jgi:hypothetical protein